MDKERREEIIREHNRLEIESLYNLEQNHVGVWFVTSKETGDLFCHVSEVKEGGFFASRSSGINRYADTLHEAITKLRNALIVYGTQGIGG